MISSQFFDIFVCKLQLCTARETSDPSPGEGVGGGENPSQRERVKRVKRVKRDAVP